MIEIQNHTHSAKAETPALGHVRPSMDICTRIAAKHGLSYRQILRQGKHKEVVRARQEFWLELVLGLGYSLPKAGRATGGHDHTTVLYGIRRFAAEHFATRGKAGIEEICAAWLLSDMPSMADAGGVT